MFNVNGVRDFMSVEGDTLILESFYNEHDPTVRHFTCTITNSHGLKTCQLTERSDMTETHALLEVERYFKSSAKNTEYLST